MPSESAPASTNAGWKIWGVDGVVYGPVELPTLVHWVKEERVVAATWIYSEQEDAWDKAADVPELRMFFPPAGAPGAAPSGPAGGSHDLAGVKPGSLRRVKILADFSDEQLRRFIAFMEIESVKQWKEVVKHGDFGDALYLVL